MEIMDGAANAGGRKKEKRKEAEEREILMAAAKPEDCSYEAAGTAFYFLEARHRQICTSMDYSCFGAKNKTIIHKVKKHTHYIIL